jgi:hypothetical protein
VVKVMPRARLAPRAWLVVMSHEVGCAKTSSTSGQGADGLPRDSPFYPKLMCRLTLVGLE